MAKSGKERMREYRERQRLLKPPKEKKPTKSGAQRSREYRERKKAHLTAWLSLLTGADFATCHIDNPLLPLTYHLSQQSVIKKSPSDGETSDSSRVPEIPFVEVKCDEEESWDLVSENSVPQDETDVKPDPGQLIPPLVAEREVELGRVWQEEKAPDGRRHHPQEAVPSGSAPGRRQEKRKLEESMAEEFEGSGRNVARKLSRMDPIQAIYAESIISTVVRMGLLGKLTEHTDICSNKCNKQALLLQQSHQISTTLHNTVKEEPYLEINID